MYKLTSLCKVGLQWLPAKSGVEQCKRAVCEVEIWRIQSKVESLKLTAEHCVVLYQKAWMEGWRVCAGSQEMTSKAKTKTGTPAKKQKWAFLLCFSFIPFRLQTHELVSLTSGAVLLSSVNSSATCRTMLIQLSQAFLTLSWSVTYHKPLLETWQADTY